MKTVRKVFLAVIMLLLHNEVTAQWVQTNGPYGGIISSFVTLGPKLFAGTDHDGLFVSSDNGVSWSPTGFQGQSVINLATLGNDLFAIVEGDFFISSDEGNNWEHRDITVPKSGAITIVVKDNVLFVGTNGSGPNTQGGIFSSSDKGSHWAHIYTVYLPNSISSLLVKGNSLYAGIYSPMGQNAGVLYSSDNGSSWDRIGLASLGVRCLGRIGNTIFASAGYAFRSTDNGLHWDTIASLPAASYVTAFTSRANDMFAASYGAGVYHSIDSGINWKPVYDGLTNSVVRCLRFLDTSLFAGTVYGGVFRSSDLGKHWAEANVGLVPTDVNALAMDGQNLFVGTELQTMYRSTDEGLNWTHYNIGNSRFTRAFAKIGSYFYAASNDYGVFRSTDDGLTWEAFNSGLTDLQILSITTDGVDLYAGSSAKGVFRLAQNASTWTELNSGFPQGVRSLSVDNSGIWAGTGGGIFYSKDTGMTWSLMDTGLTNNYINVLIKTNNHLYAGTSGGGLFKSTDSGMNWISINNGLPSGASIAALIIIGNAIFAGAEAGGVFFSIDSGKSWKSANLNLPYISSFATNNIDLFVGIRNNCVWKRPLSEMIPASVSRSDSHPSQFILKQNYPNPFLESTTIGFDIPERSFVSIKIYDLTGREVAPLVSETLDAGLYTTQFNAEDLPSGTYIYRLVAGEYQEAKTLVLMR